MEIVEQRKCQYCGKLADGDFCSSECQKKFHKFMEATEYKLISLEPKPNKINIFDITNKDDR